MTSYSSISWNAEGFSRSKFFLHSLKDSFDPDFLFLSEPHMFQCDLATEMTLFQPFYRSYLNSDDLFDLELPLTKRKAVGGTMALWKVKYDQFVTVQPCPSPSILPLLFSPPGMVSSIHITIYLPTAGKDVEYYQEVTNLMQCIDDLTNRFPDALLFIRGDANANPKNVTRNTMLTNLMLKWNLTRVAINHKTYHHFTGNGNSDSELDVILHNNAAVEHLFQVICQIDHPSLTSHHDALFSHFYLPEKSSDHCPDPPRAPRIKNERVRINWTQPGSQSYMELVSSSLAGLRDSWLNPKSQSSVSVLLQSTYALLDSCARATNPYTHLSRKTTFKPIPKPSYIINSEQSLKSSHRLLRRLSPLDPNYVSVKTEHQRRKRIHARLIRHRSVLARTQSEQKFQSICSKSPQQAYRLLRNIKRTETSKISKLSVDNLIYVGDNVPDGIYYSIEKLKTEPIKLNSCYSNFPDFSEEYRHILDIC